jgi:hypothetical protein
MIVAFACGRWGAGGAVFVYRGGGGRRKRGAANVAFVLISSVVVVQVDMSFLVKPSISI